MLCRTKGKYQTKCSMSCDDIFHPLVLWIGSFVNLPPYASHPANEKLGPGWWMGFNVAEGEEVLRPSGVVAGKNSFKEARR